MHPVGQSWVSGHPDMIQGNVARCQACHGTDYRGTVLSGAQTDRTLTANFDSGSVNLPLFRGAQIGCYNCHLGASDSNANTSKPPVVSNVSASTSNDQKVNITLAGTGAGLTFRIISQPANGTVGLSGNIATYFPNPGFVGAETFTFAAYDGSKNSGLATGTVNVVQGPFSIGATACVPTSYPAAWAAAFTVVPSVTNNASPVSMDWNFGDGSAHGTGRYATHTYSQPGVYNWNVICTVAGTSVTKSGAIQITASIELQPVLAANSLTLSWPASVADVILESSSVLGPSPQWIWVTNATILGPNEVRVSVNDSGNQFFRVQRPW